MDHDEPTEDWPAEYEESDTADLAEGSDSVDPTDSDLVPEDDAADDAAETGDAELSEEPVEEPAADGEALVDDTGGGDSGDGALVEDDAELVDDSAGEEAVAEAEPVPGTDPDADSLADDPSWQEPSFPPALDLESPPEPVDGFPWSDPELLGEDSAGVGPDPGYQAPDDTAGEPPVADLLAYDGQEADADSPGAVGTLAASEDPAVSALTRFWNQGG